MLSGQEHGAFRFEKLSLGAAYQRKALAEPRPMQRSSPADDEWVKSAFDASTVLPVVCLGASDPEECAVGPGHVARFRCVA